MTGKRCRRNGSSKKGFTLIELIMTVAILSFGIVSIYEALFVSADVYGYYTNYLNIQGWMSEKIWDVQKELITSQTLDIERESGQIVRNHKTFDWMMTVMLIDETQGLYRINITLSWNEGGKRVSTSRQAYVMPPGLRNYYEKGFV